MLPYGRFIMIEIFEYSIDGIKNILGERVSPTLHYLTQRHSKGAFVQIFRKIFLLEIVA